MRVNGGKIKNSEELSIEFNESLTLKEVTRQAVKKFGGMSTSAAKIYDKNGVLLFDEDFNLIGNGDILYIALNGENFNYCAILDDFELGKTLGVGGFGKVILARHKDNRS